MASRKLLHGSDEDLSCIGILLTRCEMPVTPCHRCWFGTDKGQPTLVRIATFHQITAAKTGDDYVAI